MLDAFVTMFVVAAILFAVHDRDRPRPLDWDRRPTGILSALALHRPWRLLAGMALGAAIAVKWSGAYVALAVIGLTAAWEIAARRSAGPDAPHAQLESRHVAGHPRGAAAQRRAAGAGAGGRVPGRLHRADAGRAHRPAMAGGHGLAWHLGSPAGDAHLPYHPGGQPPLRVAAVVLAAAEAAGRLLLQRRRRLPRDPGHRQPADLGGRRAQGWWCWRCSGHAAAGAWEARRPW